MLEKARQAERLTAERTAAQERYDRYREAVEVSTELDALGQSHPSPNPLPVVRQSVERLRSLDSKIRELTAALAGEVAVQFDVAPEPTWRPLSRWGILLVLIGAAVAVGSFVATTLGILDLGTAPLYLGGGRGRHRAHPDARRASGCAAAPRCRSSCATSRSIAGCAVAPRWRPN